MVVVSQVVVAGATPVVGCPGGCTVHTGRRRRHPDGQLLMSYHRTSSKIVDVA